MLRTLIRCLALAALLFIGSTGAANSAASAPAEGWVLCGWYDAGWDYCFWHEEECEEWCTNLICDEECCTYWYHCYGGATDYCKCWGLPE